MSIEKKKIVVTISGDDYTLLSDEAEQEIRQAALLVDTMLREVYQAGTRDLRKGAVLVALRIAALLEAERKSNRTLMVEGENLVRRLDQEIISLF